MDDVGTLFNMDYEPLTKEVEAIMQYSPHIDCIPMRMFFFILPLHGRITLSSDSPQDEKDY